MSLDPLTFGRTRLPRRNRATYPHELAILDEERGLNNNFIKALQTELAIRKIRANTTAVDVQDAVTRRAEAELRLRAATAVKNTLLKARDGLYSSFSADEPLFGHLRGLGLDNPTPHLQGTTDILAQRVQCEEFIETQIEKAAVCVSIAHNVLDKCFEEEEVALAREERCVGVIENIENCISKMKESTRPSLSGSIWRLPESIWCQIFVEAVDNVAALSKAEEAPPGVSISYPSLTLSAVCHLWRTIAQAYAALWCTIHLTIHPFTLNDARRIEHYKSLSKSQALRIIIDVPRTASADQVKSIADLLSGASDVDYLAVRGGAAGKEVIEQLSQRIKPPKALTIAFSDDCPFQRLPKRHTIADNLETLTLKNCSPAGVLKSSPPKSRKIVKLQVFNATSEKIDWCLFYERFLPLSNTVRELVLVTQFSNKSLPDGGRGPKLLSQLTSVETDFRVLLLFYNSRLFTPALRSLTITSTRAVKVEDWRAFATDQHGGANITNVDFNLSVEARVAWTALDCTPLASYLHLLPKLSTLSLQAQLVEPILKAINWTGVSMKPLGALRILSITNYRGDGQRLVSIARKYQPGRRSDSDLESNHTPTNRIDVLKVELRNCPNISREALAELTEMGSIPP